MNTPAPDKAPAATALALAALLCASGCVTRLADLTVCSTKNMDIKRTLHRVDETVRTDGRDRRHIIILFPTGIPNMKEACDRAIEKCPGAVGLSNATLEYAWWYIPYIYGQFWYTVEGNPVFEAAPQP
jgi:hypothetical protein